MGTWKSVAALEDGQNVEAATFNKPLSELASRTNYLKDMLDSLGAGGSLSSVRFSVELSEDDTPEIGDIVCVDPDSGKFVKALASSSLFDPFSAGIVAHAVGILVEKDTGTTGIVAASGYVDISSYKFNTSSMVETGETFSDGVYYLSSSDPGKITKSPKWPKILIGVFFKNELKSGSSTGDSAIVNVQYGDMSAHTHRIYELKAKPAGTQVVVPPALGSDDLPTCEIRGYAPDGIREGSSLDPGYFYPGLLLSGEWLTSSSVAYELWLSSSPESDPNASTPPSSNFSSVYLNWKSHDASEGSGSEKISGFYQKVPVGTHGLEVALDPGVRNNFSDLYNLPDDDPSFRTWTIRMPMYASGWSSNSVYANGEISSGSLVVCGVPTRIVDELHVVSPTGIFELPSDLSPGDTMEINGLSFEFVANEDSEPEEGVVRIVLQGSAFQTFRNVSAPYDADSGYSIFVDSSKAYVAAADSVSFNGTDLDPIALGGGTLTSSGGLCNVVATDENGTSLVEGGYASIPSLYSLVSTNCGIGFYISSNSSVSIPSGTTMSVVLGIESAGCFRYNIEMDGELNSVYPPVPAKSGVLTWNGVEVESSEFFGKDAVYTVGSDSLYWNDNVFGRTPWPTTFKDPEDTIDNADKQRLLFHCVSSYHSDTGLVTSLHSAEGSPIVVRRCGTTSPASVGDLELDLDLTVGVEDGNEPGYKAVKASNKGRLVLGPLVEKLIAGPGITLMQGSGQPDGQGTVTVSATNASFSGEMDTISLENAKEEVIGMFPYIRLLGWEESGTNIPTGFVVKFQVPESIPSDIYRVKLYATVFGESDLNAQSEQYAGVTMTYNILPDWTPLPGRTIETASMNLSADLISPDNPVSVDIPFGVLNPSTGRYNYKAFDPVLIHNDPSIENIEGRSYNVLGDPFPSNETCTRYLADHLIGSSVFGVRPGYIVAVRFSRSAPVSGTPYTGRVGFINLRWSLSKVTDADILPETTTTPDEAAEILEKLRKIASRYTAANLRTVDQLRAALVTILQQLK